MAGRPGLWIAVAATYVGAVIGAGFASGREILHFFVLYGSRGTLGIALAGVLFAAIGWGTLDLARRRGIATYREFLREVAGAGLAPVLDGITTLSLLAGLAVVLAGTSALAGARWGWSPAAALWTTAGGLSVFLALGLQGVFSLNVGLVPFLVVALAVTGAGSLLAEDGNWQLPVPPLLSGDWLLAAILYVSYNSLLAMGILAALGRYLPDRTSCLLAGTAGGTTLGITAFLAAEALTDHLPVTLEAPVPMSYVAFRLDPAWGEVYTWALVAAMFTTGLATAYAIGVRMAGRKAGRARWLAIGALLAAVPLARRGLVELVATLYPAVGYAGLLFLLLFLLSSLGHRPPGRLAP